MGQQLLEYTWKVHLSIRQKKGAQPEEYIIRPEEDLIKPYLEMIKVVTIAPEVEDSLDFIKKYHNTINFP